MKRREQNGPVTYRYVFQDICSSNNRS
uniref:Uncharacterized protein n=1 Tax=Arundo donax TaxID=35708 RepID=A0A0A9BCX7_ARUDO